MSAIFVFKIGPLYKRPLTNVFKFYFNHLSLYNVSVVDPEEGTRGGGGVQANHLFFLNDLVSIAISHTQNFSLSWTSQLSV